MEVGLPKTAVPNDHCQGTVLIHVDLDEGAHHPRQEMDRAGQNFPGKGEELVGNGEMHVIFVSPKIA